MDETKIEELLKQNIDATRVGNVLMLGQAMGVDVTESLARQKVLSYLSLVETQVSADSND